MTAVKVICLKCGSPDLCTSPPHELFLGRLTQLPAPWQPNKSGAQIPLHPLHPLRGQLHPFSRIYIKSGLPSSILSTTQYTFASPSESIALRLSIPVHCTDASVSRDHNIRYHDLLNSPSCSYGFHWPCQRPELLHLWSPLCRPRQCSHDLATELVPCTDKQLPSDLWWPSFPEHLRLRKSLFRDDVASM